MKLATTFQFTGDPARLTGHIRDLESAGIDVVITPEIYGFDLVSSGTESLGQVSVRLKPAEGQKDQGAEITCHFCHTRYAFDAEELRKLKEEA